ILARNEEKRLASFLNNLISCHNPYEIIVADSCSNDKTYEIAKQYCKAVKANIAGRGFALDMGAKAATGDVLLFLHVDTRLPKNALKIIERVMKRQYICWGWFKRRLNDNRIRYRYIDFFANLYSLLTGIATGDQAIFYRKSVFEQLGSFSGFPIFEDMTLCRRLKKHGPHKTINLPVIVSPRRFYENGALCTIFVNLKLTYRYFMGVNPNLLYKKYYKTYKENKDVAPKIEG
ncbi:MAG: TIGR04283 family arsenosugar biosynthesis glycosyltransferase, partial [Candidatus Anammoxibacter sp.]